MSLPTKEWIQGFHDCEGDGIDPFPLVVAALLAHEAVETLEAIIMSGELIPSKLFEKAQAIIAKSKQK